MKIKHLSIVFLIGGLTLVGCHPSPKADPETTAGKGSEISRKAPENNSQPVIADIGDDMVDGDLIDREGNIRHLSEFKGKYILLDFWNRGCGPCMKAFPEAHEIAQAYKGTLEVVGICIGNKKSMDAVLTKYQPKGNQWRQRKLGAEGLVAAYQVMSVPHYVLISPEGKILDMWTGYRKGLLKGKMKEWISTHSVRGMINCTNE